MSALNTSDVLSGVSSGLSAFSNIIAADTKADQAEFRATQREKDLEVQQDAERLQAQQKQEKLNERLQDVLAQQRAVRSASGVAVGSGSAKTDRKEAQEDAAEAKQRVADQFALQQFERESQQDQLGIRADAQPSIIRSRGLQSAFQKVGGFGLRMQRKLERREEAQEKTGEIPQPYDEDFQGTPDAFQGSGAV